MNSIVIIQTFFMESKSKLLGLSSIILLIAGLFLQAHKPKNIVTTVWYTVLSTCRSFQVTVTTTMFVTGTGFQQVGIRTGLGTHRLLWGVCGPHGAVSHPVSVVH